MSAPLWFSHPSSLDHDTGPGHPERVERIVAVEAEVARRGGLGWARREAPVATPAQLAAVHTERYLDQVRGMSEVGGGALG